MPTETGLAAAARRGRLLRVLGVTFGLAVTVGNTIGAGILSAPGQVAAELPAAALMMSAWVLGGLYALLGANSVAELGTMMPRSGGQYVYARRALGPYAGFVVGWSDWVSTCGSAAVVSLLIAEYAGKLFPALAAYPKPLAAGVALAFTALQWRGIDWGSGAQNLTSLLKALALVAFVVACFALGGGGVVQTPAAAAPPTPTGTALTVGFVVALQAVLYTYDGWTGVIYFSEEVRDPARDIPRSLFAGVGVVTAIYLLFNLALLYVLPAARLAGETLAAGAAAAEMFGDLSNTIIHALGVVALLSSVNALLLIASRVPYAMGRDGLFPAWAVRVRAGGTPTVSLLVSAAVTVVFLSGDFAEVMAVLAFFFVANYAVSFTAVFVLRRREPDAERPFRAWGYPWTTGLALVGSIIFLAGAVYGDTAKSLLALLVLALSYPVYLLVRRLSDDEDEH